MKAKELLQELKACEESIVWVGDRTIEEAWNECERGDWMLWLYAALYPNNTRELSLAKGHTANTVRHLMKDERSIKAVDATIAFGEGRITEAELNEADASANAAAQAFYDNDTDDDAVVYAAAAVADATYTPNTAEGAEAAAAVAAYAAAAAAAAAADAAYAAADAAKIAYQKIAADVCRDYLTIEGI